MQTKGPRGIRSDIEIAQGAALRPIVEVARGLGLDADDIEPYGKYKAKVALGAIRRLEGRPYGKLIYVSAITATPAGEGKTSTAVGLTQALGKLGKKAMVALREPSLGPTFGVKGGACGGGYAQVVPMEDINLHFTGDIHAVGAAHNLLAAMVDNHIHHGNELGIDSRRIVWRRVMDISDRQLRNIIVGLGGRANGFPAESGFDITVASEVMACLGLSRSLSDLKERLGKLVVAYARDGRPITASDLKAVGAMAVILKDTLKPNLVQTLEGQPAFVHGAPFANIAYGNSSLLATETALRLADCVVTEGGFAADLGAEKFFDIVCRITDVRPDVVVLVASVRALHHHGGASKSRLAEKDVEALSRGCENLDKHVRNLREKFGLPVVVAINRFPSDDPEELERLGDHCSDLGVPSAVSEVVARGGEGGIELAETVLDEMGRARAAFRFLYELDTPVKEKIEIIAREIYGADGVDYVGTAGNDIKVIEDQGLGGLPICVAKTQLSLSDDPARRGAPRGWRLTVRQVRVAAGAGFIVPLCGDIMTMPGLPKRPAAEGVDIDDEGRIVGLF